MTTINKLYTIMALNSTFNIILVMSCQTILLVEETEVFNLLKNLLLDEVILCSPHNVCCVCSSLKTHDPIHPLLLVAINSSICSRMSILELPFIWFIVSKLVFVMKVVLTNQWNEEVRLRSEVILWFVDISGIVDLYFH